MQTRLQVLNKGGNPEDLHGSEGGLLHTLDYKTVWTAKQYGKQAMATGALAGLVVRPAALSHLTIFNPPSSGVHLVIERAFAHFLVTAQTELGSIWLCSHPVGMTAPTGNNITVRNSTGGKAAGGSATIVDTAEAVTDDGWFPWGEATFTPLDGTVPGGAMTAQVNGRIIVPPNAGLSIQVVSSTTANTFTDGFHWYEVPTSELVLG